MLLLYCLLGLGFQLSYPLSFARVLINFTPLAWPFRLSLSKYKPKSEADGPSWVVVTGPTGDVRLITRCIANWTAR